MVPSAQSFDAEYRSFAESLLEGGVVGDLLHSLCESIYVAVGDDEPLLAIGEEVFCAGGGGGEDRTSACHGLPLDECETLFNAGQNKQVADAHLFSEVGLRESPGEDDVFAGQGCEQDAHVILNVANDGEALLRVTQAGEGLQEVRDSFADADLAGEEDFERVLRWIFGASETIEADAVRDDVNFFGGEAHL